MTTLTILEEQQEHPYYIDLITCKHDFMLTEANQTNTTLLLRTDVLKKMMKICDFDWIDWKYKF